MKRKLLSGALALVMLAGCTAPVPDTQKLPDDGGEETRVAYVPLDDRPVNTDRVEYLAGSLGYELVMPDAEAYRTRLDEQPLGESGLKYGDRAALYEWVLEQEESGCDRYILSLDQLLSGGLVNSRCFTGADVTLSDGTTMTEPELIESLAEGHNDLFHRGRAVGADCAGHFGVVVVSGAAAVVAFSACGEQAERHERCEN